MNKKIISILSVIVLVVIVILGIVICRNDVSIQVKTVTISLTSSSGNITQKPDETESIKENNTSKEELLSDAKERLEAKLNIVTEYLQTSGSDKTVSDFLEWFSKYYNVNIINELANSNTDNINRDFYMQTGKSLFVLCDEFVENNDVIKITAAKTDEFNFLFAGDICLAEDGFVLDYYDTTTGLKDCISKEILDMTNSADLFMANNEFSISDKGEPLAGKLYTFRANPNRVSILKEFGIDIVSLGNNHVYDYGRDAFLDTMTNLKNAEITYVGAGENINEASKVIYYQVNGIKIGIVSASSAEKVRYTPEAKDNAPGIFRMYDTKMLLDVSNAASKKCDFLIAYLHWGTEDSDKYEEYQHNLAVELKNNGVDAIIGGHPHILQGVEYIGDMPVIYSMGDFW